MKALVAAMLATAVATVVASPPSASAQAAEIEALRQG